jgi:hypothetical protein
MRDDYLQEKADPAWTQRQPAPEPSRADLHHVFLQQRIKEALGRGDMRTVRMLSEQDAVNQTRPVEPSEFQPTDLAVPGLQSALSTLASAPGRAMVGGALRAAPGAMVKVAQQAKSLPLRASTDYQKNALWKALSGEEPSAAQKLNAMIRNRTMADPRVTLESRLGDTSMKNQFWTPQNEFGYTPQMERMLEGRPTFNDTDFAQKMWGPNVAFEKIPGQAGRDVTHAVRTQGQKMLPAAQSQEARLSSALEGPAGAAPEGAPFAMPAQHSDTAGLWPKTPVQYADDTFNTYRWDTGYSQRRDWLERGRAQQNAPSEYYGSPWDYYPNPFVERSPSAAPSPPLPPWKPAPEPPPYPFPDKRNLDDYYGPGASMDRMYSDYPPTPSRLKW